MPGGQQQKGDMQMGKILNITQVTNNRFLNIYNLDVEDKKGRTDNEENNF